MLNSTYFSNLKLLEVLMSPVTFSTLKSLEFPMSSSIVKLLEVVLWLSSGSQYSRIKSADSVVMKSDITIRLSLQQTIAQ